MNRGLRKAHLKLRMAALSNETHLLIKKKRGVEKANKANPVAYFKPFSIALFYNRTAKRKINNNFFKNQIAEVIDAFQLKIFNKM